MRTLTTTEHLAAFCADARQHAYVTVDTEFLRERTYFAQLCLVQLAVPGEGEDSAVLVDVLSDDLKLDPLYALFDDPSVVKVFHAARQDLEIFYVDHGALPTPLFDTQIAAMVCGYGEQVGYETLVRSICKASLDKSSRFTDWSRRPLSDRQKKYALGDVTHLRGIYEHLSQKLEETGRASWVAEELAVLTSPETYIVEPREAWQRVRMRSSSPRFAGIVRELAELREVTARERNVPRGRIFKDDVILELAGAQPQSIEDLSRARLLQREARKDPLATQIVEAVKRALSMDKDDLPKPPPPHKRNAPAEGLPELLRVLLKARSGDFGVAQKLIATSADLDALASGDMENLLLLRGWRNEVFGADALRLCHGEIGLTVGKNGVETVDL
ncbi:ribonuclease D [Halovulum sp. GXIMD14793]